MTQKWWWWWWLLPLTLPLLIVFDAWSRINVKCQVFHLDERCVCVFHQIGLSHFVVGRVLGTFFPPISTLTICVFTMRIGSRDCVNTAKCLVIHILLSLEVMRELKLRLIKQCDYTRKREKCQVYCWFCFFFAMWTDSRFRFQCEWRTLVSIDKQRKIFTSHLHSPVCVNVLSVDRCIQFNAAATMTNWARHSKTKRTTKKKTNNNNIQIMKNDYFCIQSTNLFATATITRQTIC